MYNLTLLYCTVLLTRASSTINNYLLDFYLLLIDLFTMVNW